MTFKAILAASVLSTLSVGSAGATVLTAGDITNPLTQYFNPGNSHIYEVVNHLATWTEGYGDAQTRSINGVQGHLVTISSAGENQYVFDLTAAHVTTGWDFGSVWIGVNDLAVTGEWRTVAGPDAGQQVWQDFISGHGFPGIYSNFILGDFYNANAACAGSGSGCWSNPTGTGSQFAFLNGTHWRPGGWGIGYSSISAVTTGSSPIAGIEGMRNAYIVEYSGSVPEPAAWSLMILGFGVTGQIFRSRRRFAEKVVSLRGA